MFKGQGNTYKQTRIGSAILYAVTTTFGTVSFACAQDITSSTQVESSTQATLGELLRAAQDYNAELKASSAGLEISREVLNEVKASYRPRLTLSGGYSVSDREAVLQNGQVFDQYTEPKRISLGLNQTLFTGGRRKHLKDSAEHDIEAEEARHADRSMSVSSDIIRDYISYRSALNQNEILFQSIDKLRGIEKAASARFRTGDGTRIQLAQANSRLAASQAELDLFRCYR